MQILYTYSFKIFIWSELRWWALKEWNRCSPQIDRVYIYIYIYVYKFTKNAIVRLPHPWSGDSQGQETFLAPPADKQTRNYDTKPSLPINTK